MNDEQIKKLEIENKHLKSKILHYEEIFKLNVRGFDTGCAAEAYGNMVQNIGSILIKEENIKLKVSLIEIRDIVKGICRIVCNDHIRSNGYCTTYCTHYKILQKIDEVIKERK